MRQEFTSKVKEATGNFVSIRLSVVYGGGFYDTRYGYSPPAQKLKKQKTKKQRDSGD